MHLAREQFALIEHLLPVQRGNVRIDNLTLLNAILYVAVNGCTWRGLPAEYGRWHTVYTRMSRWAKAGVLDRVFEELQMLQALSPNAVHLRMVMASVGALVGCGQRSCFFRFGG